MKRFRNIYHTDILQIDTPRKAIWTIALCGVVLLWAGGMYLINGHFISLTVAVSVLTFWAMTFLSFEQLIFLMIFLTPLSFPFSMGQFMEISILSEPLMIACTILFIFQLAKRGTYPKNLLYHPVTIGILINWIWMFFCTPFSTIPAFSLKFCLARTWFLFPSFFAMSILFMDTSRIRKFFYAYGLSFAFVVIYSSIITYASGFSHEGINYASRPFYSDHTIYGAAVGIFIPFAFFFAIDKQSSFWQRFSGSIGLLIFSGGLLLSFTRAAWVSVGMAVMIYFIIVWHIKFWKILTVLGSVIVLFFLFQTPIMNYLQDKSGERDFSLGKHIASISNLQNDQSNLERINRWSCAIRMGNERPWTGWGPRTYQFEYAPFQHYNQRTLDSSSNTGDFGNAHSEYLGPFAETGWLGMLSIIFIFGSTFYTAIKIYYRCRKTSIGNLALLIAIALLTYYIHGFLNNYLDTDKLSVLVWGLTAAIVAIDVKTKTLDNLSTIKI